MSNLHKRISQARKSRKLSQANVAERLGVTRTACSHWETARAKPSTKHVEKIAETLAVNAHWLLSGKKKEAPGHAASNDLKGYRTSDSIVFENRQGYEGVFDKDTLKVAEGYFALNRRHRKLVRDLLSALSATDKMS